MYAKQIKELEDDIGEFTKSNIYLISSFPYVGKTTFGIELALTLTARNKRVLFIGSDILKSDFEKQLLEYNALTLFGNPQYIQLHYLDNKRFDDMLNADEYDFVIIDSDTLMLDVDIGLLKETIRDKNVGILITKQLTRQHFTKRSKQPTLSNLKFINQKTKLKYIAYSDAIIALYNAPESSEKRFSILKNMIAK